MIWNGREEGSAPAGPDGSAAALLGGCWAAPPRDAPRVGGWVEAPEAALVTPHNRAGQRAGRARRRGEGWRGEDEYARA